MIDDKKIEDAANQHSEESYISSYFQACYKDAFIEGAKWAINEFIKDLLHPASEKPKRRFNYLLLHYKDEEEECFEADVVDTKAWDLYIKGSLVEYINIDDLFIKKEYGHD